MRRAGRRVHGRDADHGMAAFVYRWFWLSSSGSGAFCAGITVDPGCCGYGEQIGLLVRVGVPVHYSRPDSASRAIHPMADHCQHTDWRVCRS